MRTFNVAFLCLISAVSVAADAPKPAVVQPPNPPVVRTLRKAVGSLVIVHTDAVADVYWYVEDAAGEYHVDADGKSVVLSASKPAKYLVIAFWINGTRLVAERTTVIVDSTESVMAVIKSAVDADLKAGATAGDKRRMALVLSHASGLSADAKHKTAGDLFTAVEAAAPAFLSDKAMPQTKAAMSEHLRTNLPTDAAHVLTDADRQAFQRAFKAMAAAVEGK